MKQSIVTAGNTPFILCVQLFVEDDLERGFNADETVSSTHRSRITTDRHKDYEVHQRMSQVLTPQLKKASGYRNNASLRDVVHPHIAICKACIENDTRFKQSFCKFKNIMRHPHKNAYVVETDSYYQVNVGNGDRVTVMCMTGLHL